MKLFIAIKRHTATIGVHKLQPGEVGRFNRRNVGVLVLFEIFFTSATGYILYDINTIQEYAICFFEWVTLLSVFIGFVIMIFQSADVFCLIEHFEQSIENRK